MRCLYIRIWVKIDSEKWVFARYGTLREEDIKALVVNDKWSTVERAIHGEIEHVSQGLTERVRALAERYTMPMAAMTARVAELEMKVQGHLARMGFG